jgi:hypothetical protein
MHGWIYRAANAIFLAMNATQKHRNGQGSRTPAALAVVASPDPDLAKRMFELQRLAKRAMRGRASQSPIQPVLFLSTVSSLAGVERVMAVGLELAENKENTPKDQALGAALVIQAAKGQQRLAEQVIRLERECGETKQHSSQTPRRRRRGPRL